ncbi:MAG TPA: hypothetical protein DCG19_07405 [Cryomorphaceae bacterium]|nr:hypothetical protein [Owenweeksia sp.]MBF97895.1 hypothetical protein [Owenweeksia sp.]HAD97218.1 hypothetical protein [Cryomorphaceae bacterium]HBF18632.1 hypothetical protein [Cryomorphaceae bacterium]|tara:strand:+ start:479 stop:748 length:270 start_codon:yes stop_codon:yes gene_type:complete
MKESKCEHCGFWTNGKLEKCNYCGGILNEAYHAEREQLKKAEGMKIPFIQIHADDHWFVKMYKSVFRFGQLVFFMIITFLAMIASSTVH